MPLCASGAGQPPTERFFPKPSSTGSSFSLRSFPSSAYQYGTIASNMTRL